MHSLCLGSTSDKTHLSRHLKLPDSIKYTLNIIWVIQQHRICRWYTPFRYRGITHPFPRPCVVARQHLSTYIIHIFISHFILATSYSSSDWFRNPDTEQNLVKLACLNVCRSRLELQRDPQFDIPMKINQRITNKIDKQKRFNGKQTILFSSQGFFLLGLWVELNGDDGGVCGDCLLWFGLVFGMVVRSCGMMECA